jgi:hypothetical protein
MRYHVAYFLVAKKMHFFQKRALFAEKGHLVRWKVGGGGGVHLLLPPELVA